MLPDYQLVVPRSSIFIILALLTLPIISLYKPSS